MTNINEILHIKNPNENSISTNFVLECDIYSKKLIFDAAKPSLTDIVFFSNLYFYNYKMF